MRSLLCLSALVVSQSLESIEREYERLVKLDPQSLGQSKPKESQKVSRELIDKVEKVLAALDARGRWVEDGRLRYQGDDDPTCRIITCHTFIANTSVLSRYLAAKAD